MKEIILILVMQLVYVPVFTLRTLFLVKNMIAVASVLGFVEALVYVFGLSLVFTGDQTTLAMIVYAVGFGVGILLGGYIENKLAIGYHSFTVNLLNRDQELIDRLREEGFGVTIYQGEGRDSLRYKLEILTKRSREDELVSIIHDFEPGAFIISYEPRKFKGGFMVSTMKKSQKRFMERNKNQDELSEPSSEEEFKDEKIEENQTVQIDDDNNSEVDLLNREHQDKNIE
ncbi:DUF2179 domain-containing protein [Alkalibacter mobilis]|uniref:DUF2179 domain-containing protein n=1 Tax=Alkalibacter mobilis TaxID=2787712 RepID=UPI00189DEF0F|nr:DUF2179 domain-containing protein [Alkalibacter mobilis]